MILRILLVAALQIVALVGMVADRMWLLSSGREVVLQSRPVDPSDLFRGDYVVLTYDISQLQAWDVPSDRTFRTGETIFVSLQPSASGKPGEWAATRIDHNKPTAVADGTLLLRGTVTNASTQYGTSVEEWANEGKPDFYPPMSEKPKHLCPGGCPVLNVAYGIESFFLEQGAARPIEEQRNDGSLSVKVSVDTDGRAGVKSLLIDGQPIAESTLF